MQLLLGFFLVFDVIVSRLRLNKRSLAQCFTGPHLL